jgi:hypothetical protein
MRRPLTSLLVLSLVLAPAALAAKLSAPRTAHVGDSVKASAGGLKAGRYVLRLVSDSHAGRSTACVARVAGRKAAKHGAVTLTGTVPRRLTCWENDSVKLGRVPVKPGAYHLVVGVPDGPTGFSAKHSFVRSALTIKR